MNKKIISMLCVISMLLSLLTLPLFAATTNTYVPTNIPSTFPVSKQDPNATVINFWTSTGGNNILTAMSNITNWFNSTIGRQKKIYVKNVFQGAYTEIATKIQATVQAKNPKSLPDVAMLAPQGVFALKESAYILYIQDLMEADKTFKIKDKLNPNLLYGCSYKGKVMGLPFGNVSLVYHYNADAYRAAGLDPTKPPKTMSELAEYCKKLVIKNTKGATTRQSCTYKIDATNLATWVTRQKGGKGEAFQFDQEDGRTGVPTRLICAEDGTLKATLTEWKKVVDTGTVDIKTVNGTESFSLGQTASFFYNMNSYPLIESYFKGIKDASKKFEHKMSRLPSINANDGISSHIGGAALYMFNREDEKKKAAAWEFVKFLSSAEVSAYWAVNSGNYALNSDALKTKFMQDFFKKDPNTKAVYDILADSIVNVKAQAPMIPNSTAYMNIVSDQGYMYFTGKQSVEKAVENIAKKENAILKNWMDANK